ncbi:MAG: GNAT family N-acetyltransferase [Oscillospiraceae bacterium]|jgi:GNAT superfamily N-acetyltransferase|nr:GNAT family N-acetyltransferase [Oscillospiraceae bacterium]
MTDKQYSDMILQGHFLYWDMLSTLHGVESHNESNLRWLTGNINYNYYIGDVQVDDVAGRIKNGDIPNNLLFLVDNPDTDPSEPFVASGMFKKDFISFGMAHELLDIQLPKPDNRLNVFRVREISQLKAAGAILNSVFHYRLFTFGHFLNMFENNGQFFYLAEYDGIPVGAVMAQHKDSFVNISWVGTLPGYRKLGIAGYLIQMAERDGILNGKTTGVLHGFPDAVGSYRRIGYKTYSRGIGIEFIGGKS